MEKTNHADYELADFSAERLAGGEEALADYAGKVLLIVNTASQCGFTPQFKGLEALYQRYKGQGLEVLGVPSDDFRQEADDSAETAKVCFIDYGVTFAMSEPQVVSGEAAAPLFRELAAQSSAPRWNFYKYVVGRDGKVIASFSSLTKPDDAALIEAIDKASNEHDPAMQALDTEDERLDEHED